MTCAVLVTVGPGLTPQHARACSGCVTAPVNTVGACPASPGPAHFRVDGAAPQRRRKLLDGGASVYLQQPLVDARPPGGAARGRALA